MSGKLTLKVSATFSSRLTSEKQLHWKQTLFRSCAWVEV